MAKDLYDVIEELDILNSELYYQFKVNKAFINSLTEEIYLKNTERFNVSDGIEYTYQGLLKRFENISKELGEINKKC